MVNNTIGTMDIPTFNLAGNTNLAVDVDLASETMDRIDADTYSVTNNANLNVTQLNLLSDATKENTSILFADEDLASNVIYTGSSSVAYSPIFKYDVSYSQNPDDNLGYFNFTRSAVKSESFNPSVLPTPVAQQAGAFTTQMQTFN